MSRPVRALTVGVLVSALAGSTLPLLAGGTALAAPALFEGLPGPMLVGPDDHLGTDSPVVKDLVLDWTAVTGAARYQVQVSPNEDWTNNLTLDEPIVPTRWAPPVTLPHASYFWRVRALGPAGERGAWSDAGDKRAWTFTRDWYDRPESTGPAPSMTDLRFSWRPIPSASFYEVDVQDSQSRVVGLCYTNHTTVTPYTLPANLPGMDAAEKRHRNGGCTVLTAPEPDPPDVEPDPDAEEPLGLTPGQTYTWRVRGRDGTAEPELDAETAPTATACRQVADPVTFEAGQGATVPECSFGSTAASFVYAPRPVTYDRLRVEGCDEDSAGVFNCTDTPTITWPGTGSGEQTYQVELALEPTFSDVLRVYTTRSRSLTPRDSLLDNQAGRSYYVRVRGPGIDATTNFRKRSAPVTLSSPADDVRLRDRHITFRWSDYLTTGGAPAQEAQAYRLQVSRDPDFDTLVDDVVVDLREHTAPDREFADGEYFWRMQPIDAGRNNLTWSATRSFVRDTVRPTAALRSSAVAALTAPVLVQFSEPVQGVAASSVMLRDAGDKTVPATVSLSADKRTATVTPSARLVPGMPYRVLLSTAIQDLAGNALTATSLSLRADPTVDSSSPAARMRWDRDTSGVASGGSYVTSGTQGAQLALDFSGRSLTVTGRRAPDGGYADLYVDGKLVNRASFYAAKTAYATVYRTTVLPDGPHTLRLVVVGDGPAASAGNVVVVDTMKSATTTYQDDSSRVTQSWADYFASNAINSSYRVENSSSRDSGTQPSVGVQFYGTSARVYACKSPGSGRAGILVDGKLKATVDLYQSFTSCGVQVFATPALSNGLHTVQLVATGTMSARATGARVSFDALRVSAPGS